MILIIEQRASRAAKGRTQVLYYLSLGVNILYIVGFAQIWFYKAVLNKAI